MAEHEQPHPPPIPERSKRSALVHILLPLALLLALAGEYWLAQRAHRTPSDLAELIRVGSLREQVYAAHVITNRGDPPNFNRNWIRTQLTAENLLLRELMMTPNMMRYGKARIRRLAIEEHYTDKNAIVRCDFLLAYRIGNYTAMSLDELRRFLDAAKAGP